MKRRFDYDVLRVASMLGVIFLHSAAGPLQNIENRALWGFCNFFNVISATAVPLFFMMSGALLLASEKTNDPRDALLRRIPRLLIPLLCWSLPILAYIYIRVDRDTAVMGLKYLFNTPAMVPYWFLYALIPIYLLTPMLKRMTDGLDDRQWRYMMTLWVVFTLGLVTLRSFLPFEWQYSVTAHPTLNINMVGGYLGYFLLGAYLERIELPPRGVLIGGTVGMLAVNMVGSYLDTYAHMACSDRFTTYIGIFNMLLSSFFFLLAKSCLRGREEKGKLLPLLAGNSFGVYLAHAPAIVVVQKLLMRMGLPKEPWDIPSMAGFFLAVALGCIIGSVLLSSVPGLCSLFTGQTYAAACKGSNLQFLLGRKKND